MLYFSLKAGRHIFYIGYCNLGIVGIIDASECPPTYGAGRPVSSVIDTKGDVKITNQDYNINYT